MSYISEEDSEFFLQKSEDLQAQNSQAGEQQPLEEEKMSAPFNKLGSCDTGFDGL